MPPKYPVSGAHSSNKYCVPQLTRSMQTDKDAKAAISSHEQVMRAQEARFNTAQAEQTGVSASGSGSSAPTTSTTIPATTSGIPMDSLDAYVQITEQQHRILQADARFNAFQRENQWGTH